MALRIFSVGLGSLLKIALELRNRLDRLAVMTIAHNIDLALRIGE